MHRPHIPARQQGITLLELMIALTLGLIVIAALVGVFMASSQNFRQNQALATLQDNARFALDSLSRDLAMAGYWGGVRAADAGGNVRVSAAAAAAVSQTGTEGDCGPAAQAAGYYWLFDTSAPIVFRDHTLGLGSIANDFRCLLPANVQANTDVLMIRRVSGVEAYSDTRPQALVSNRFYVKTNRNIAALFRATSTTFNLGDPADCPDSAGLSEPCPPTSTPVQVYAYTPQIYYIRNYLKTAGDQKPILCRRYLDDSTATAFMKEDCLAEGVENLQIEWGVGTETVENYLRTPTPDQLRNARTARISILVRATDRNVQASNDAKTFTLAGYSVPHVPGLLRRAFTTTVQLKNIQP
jgi:type IV pilus assembly protein PilW